MKISNEAKIGAMVFTAVVLLAVLTIKAGNFNFSRNGYTVKIQFKRIDGVRTNAPVMLNGLEVGLVKEIKILDSVEETKLELVAFIDEEVKLREGTEAFVKNMGFMGEKYIGLSAGDKGNYLQEGAVITGKEPADFDSLLVEGRDIATNVKAITADLKERLEVNRGHIDNTLRQLDEGTKNFASLSQRVDDLLAENDPKIDDIIANLRSSSVNLEEFTYDLKMNPWKLMYRSKENTAKKVRDAP